MPGHDACPPRRPTTQQAVGGWFTGRGWKPFAFQRQVGRAMAEARSGLVHATTGAGKTYAVWLGALQALAGSGAALKEKKSEKGLSPCSICTCSY